MRLMDWKVPYHLVFDKLQLINYISSPFLEHLLMGDEIATAEALLTVCSFHASNAAPRAPAPKYSVNIHKENLKYLPVKTLRL